MKSLEGIALDDFLRCIGETDSYTVGIPHQGAYLVTISCQSQPSSDEKGTEDKHFNLQNMTLALVTHIVPGVQDASTIQIVITS